jgi:hypothetical protein
MLSESLTVFSTMTQKTNERRTIVTLCIPFCICIAYPTIDKDVGGWTILKWILREIGWDGVDWIELAQDRDQWRALVNMVMNLRVP